VKQSKIKNNEVRKNLALEVTKKTKDAKKKETETTHNKLKTEGNGKSQHPP